MARYPEIQTKVHAEIDDELGLKSPSIIHKSKLKFTDAVLCEVQRIASLLPIAVHRVTKTISLRGFTIPENSTAVANLYAIHRDERVWKDPQHFHVENFYDEKSRSLKNTEQLIPFSLGSFLLLRIQISFNRTEMDISRTSARSMSIPRPIDINFD